MPTRWAGRQALPKPFAVRVLAGLLVLPVGMGLVCVTEALPTGPACVTSDGEIFLYQDRHEIIAIGVISIRGRRSWSTEVPRREVRIMRGQIPWSIRILRWQVRIIRAREYGVPHP